MFRIKKILNDLVSYAYAGSPNLKAYQAFYIEYVDKELKSKHGDYDKKERRIHIYNLSRTEEQLIVTTIHELAHHITLIDHDSCQTNPHGPEFYDVYKRLLFTAMDMGLFNRYLFLKTTADASDSRKVAKLLETYKRHPIDYKKDLVLIQVLHGFDSREALKAHDYRYNTLNKAWEKETDTPDVETEFLDSIGVKYKIVSAKSIGIG